MAKTIIIAEAGVNHNGSVELAQNLIDAAVEAGADAVKFQTFQSEKLTTKFASKAAYQKRTTDQAETQLEMLKKLELSHKAHKQLALYCMDKGIMFLSTPFDMESLKFLTQELELNTIKISSGDLTNAPLLLELAQSNRDVILSTGMANLGEIEFALAVLAYGYLYKNKKPDSIHECYLAYASSEGQNLLSQRVKLLQCTTEYPAPFHEANLRAMDTLRQAFNLPVGLSDHTEGIAIPIAAVARGAVIIEKHFTLSRNLPGPDHQSSLEPEELKMMVTSIRQVEQALGHPVKVPALSEMNNRPIARKSIVAKKNIKKGERFTEENITVKRPGHGLSPMYYWELLGQSADRDYQEDEVIMPWTSQ